MSRDIDQLIASLRASYPDITIQEERAAQAGADEDGLWVVRHPAAFIDVRVESSTGQMPFQIESDLAPPVPARTVSDAAAIVVARLGLALGAG